MRRWIVIADAADARIFSTCEGSPLKLVCELKHPASRTKAQEIDADRPGRLQKGKGNQTRSAMEPKTGTHRIQLQDFAAETGNYLHAANDRHEFDALALIAPPRFLGLLRKQLDSKGVDYFHQGIARDFAKVTPHDLPAHVDEVLKEWLRDEVPSTVTRVTSAQLASNEP